MVIFVLLLSLLLYFKNRPLSIAMMFIMAFDGMHIIPQNDGLLQAKDGALIHIVIITLFNSMKMKNYFHAGNIQKSINLFLIYIVISALFSYFYYGFNIIQIISVARTFFYPLSFFLIRNLSESELKKTIYILFVVTSIALVVFIFQIPLNRHLLLVGSEEKLDANSVEVYAGIPKFTNTPHLSDLFLFVLFLAPLYRFSSKGFFKQSKTSLKLLFLVALLATLGRSSILISLCLLVVGYCIKNKKYIIYFIPSVVILAPVFIYVLASDISRGMGDDLAQLTGGGYKDYQSGSRDGATLTYRIAWFYERLQYLQNRPLVEQMFGMGFISDIDKDIYKYYEFYIEDYEPGNKNYQILYSYDISWGNFVTRYGILGTFIYLCIWYKLGCFLSRNKKSCNWLGLAFLLFLFKVILGGVTSNEFSNTVSLLPFFLIYALIYKSNKNEKTIDNNNQLQQQKRLI